MEIGIVGLPHSGKNTLFSTLLSHKSVGDAFKPRREADRGVIRVLDERLDRLTSLFNPQKQVHATVEYVLVPGLETERKGETGLPAQFLANLRNVDAILLVARAFENELYPHPLGRVNAKEDIVFASSEFIFSDLCIAETRIERLQKQLKRSPDENDRKELAALERCKAWLEQDRPLRDMQKNHDEEKRLRGFQFLSAKPILYVVNVNEEDLPQTQQVLHEFAFLQSNASLVTVLCATIEKEISELEDEDQALFLEDLGIEEPALPLLIRKGYELLGLISFFTVGEDECRAWTVRKGSSAQTAAGVIHSDLERGFIRAAVVSYDELVRQGSLANCKSKGVLRLEGKEYPVKDGDVMEIRSGA